MRLPYARAADDTKHRHLATSRLDAVAHVNFVHCITTQQSNFPELYHLLAPQTRSRGLEIVLCFLTRI